MSKDSKVTTIDDEVQSVESVKPILTKDSVQHDGEYYNVTFYPTGDESGDQIIDVGVNGYVIRFERGVPKRVSKSFKDGIDNMIITTYKQVDGVMVEKHTPRFPYSAVPA